MHSIATMQHAHNAGTLSTHCVTACTGHDPSVIVERVRVGPSSGSPASPMHCAGTCTGRTSQAAATRSNARHGQRT
eukprot:3490774-Prymnesium_polylepis.1